MTTPDSSALATAPSTNLSSGVFSGLATFEGAQRMARALASSTLVPPQYQGQNGLSNCLIALEISGRMRLSPLVVMQNMVPINGKPTWSASFLIATVNASGRFSPLRFVFDDDVNPNNCYAVATDKVSRDELRGQMITVEMAKAEGWWGRKGSKWPTMTGQMLTYRAASAWARIYCPEVSLGLVTPEEALDVDSVAVAVVDSPVPVEKPLPAFEAETVEAEPVAPPATVEDIAPLEPLPTAAAPAAQAEASCRAAGLTDAGIAALVHGISQGECSSLRDLPLELLTRLAKAGVSPEMVSRCNGAAPDPELPAAESA
jgi:hypothetical protein